MINKTLASLGRLSDKALTAITLSSIAVTVGVMALVGPLLLTGTERYSDIVVGEITFSDAYKHGDILASFTTIVLFFAIWWLLALPAAGLSRNQDNQEKHEVGLELELQWFMPLFFCYFAGIVLIKYDSGNSGLAISLLMLAVYGVTAQMRKGKTESRQVALALLAGVVTAGGLFFSVAALAVTAKFFFPQALLPVIPPQLPLYAGGLGLLSTAFFFGMSKRALLRVVHWAQLLTPLLILAGFCRVYQGADGITQNLAMLTAKGVGLALAISLLGANLLQMLRTRNDSSLEPRDLPLLPSILAVSAFLAYGTPEFLATDLFHHGELLLAWQQLFEKGQFPFSGFAIARGFGDAMPGFINALLFGGTYATFTFAVALPNMAIAALNAALFCRLLGNGWGAVFALATAAPPYTHSSLFLACFLLLVLPKLLARPLLWLVFWVFISVGLCLFHTTSGIALTAGSLPVAAWIACRAVRGGNLREAWQRRRGKLLGTVGAMIVVLLLLSPLLFSWLTYVREQGMVNELANGTILLRDLAIAPWFRWQNRWTWEALRIGGWLLGIFLLWHLFVRERVRQTERDGSGLPSTVEAIALMGIVSTVAFIPYSMGRIDGKGLSRTGSVSMIVLGILLPLFLVLGTRGRKKTALIAAVFLLGIGSAAYYETPSQLANKALQAVALPADARMVDGRAMGLHKVGNAYMNREAMGNLQAVKGMADRFLRPGESYLDLTNHVGYYYLLDLKVNSIYAGYYIVTSEELQKKVIAALTKNPPPVVLAGPPRTFGSGSAALRSYRLYRWLLQHSYVPVQANGLPLLVREDRYRELFSTLPPVSEQARLLSGFFGEEYLAGIPSAWGKNMGLLGWRFRKSTISLQQTALTQGSVRMGDVKAPVVAVEMVASEPIRGGEFDFLQLKLTGEVETVLVKVSWSEEGGTFTEWQTLAFDVKPDVPALIPLGSQPGWLMARNIRKLKFEIIGGQGRGQLSLEPTFLALVD